MLLGAESYWADRSGGVFAWLHYRVDNKSGVHTPFITGICGEFRWPELLDRLENLIYIAKEEVDNIRKDNSGRYRAVQGYFIVVQAFPH